MIHEPPILPVSIAPCDLSDPTARAAIEAYVASHSRATPFHRPDWIEAVAQSTGNRAHMLVARSDCGTIQGLVPLNEIRSVLFGHALVSSAYAVDGGILANSHPAAEALAKAVWNLALEQGCPTAELRGGMSPGAGWRVQNESHIGFSRPLAVDEAAELASIPRKHRAEVRKALANNGLRTETGMSETLLRDHYATYAQSVRNLGTPVFSRRLFRSVARAFGKDADILVVYHDKTPVSAVFTLYHRDMCMPFWGGGVQAARQLRSNELMYFRLMEHARARGYRTFDFGRSKVGSGQAKWKQSWGFEPQPLTYFLRDAAGVARDINPDSPKYRARIALWKKLPLPIANLLGPFISRSLG